MSQSPRLQQARRRVTAVLAVLALSVATPPVGGQSAAAGNSTGDSSQPNILFLFADDQRPDTIQAWGNSRINTPNLDALVGSGFSFRNAYNFGSNSSAVCVPSRAMVLTGRSWMRSPSPRTMKGVATLPLELAAAGYRRFITGKWHNGQSALLRSFDHGTAVYLGGMADHTKVEVRDIRGGTLGNSRIGGEFSSKMFADATIEFLDDQVGSNEPFFAYVAFMAPHDPRNPPLSYRQPYYRADLPLPANFMPQHPFNITDLGIRGEKLDEWPRRPEVIRDQLAEYYGLITHLDDQVGRILAALDENGQAQNTVVVYAADNGLALGSHGLMAKQSLYEHSVGVPLIIKGPGIPHGSTEGLTSLYDLFPTLLGLAGVDPPTGIDGKDLAALWSSNVADWRPHLLLAYRDSIRALRGDRYKLIVYTRIDHRELFDLETDPHELTNLAEVEEHAETVARLERLMHWYQVAQGDRILLRPPSAMPFYSDLTSLGRSADRHQPDWIKEKYFKPQVISVQHLQQSSESADQGITPWRIEFRRDVTDIDGTDFQISGEGIGEPTIRVTAVEDSERVFDVSVTAESAASLVGLTGTLDFSAAYDIKDLDSGTVPRAWPLDEEREHRFAPVQGPNPTVAEVSITSATSQVIEGADAAFAVSLGSQGTGPATVLVAISETGSVLAPTNPTSVTVADGETSATLSVLTVDDMVVESDSTVTATLIEGDGYSLGTASSASVTVEDDDTARFTVTAAPERIDEGGTAALTVAISNGVTFADDQVVTLAVSGTASSEDYTGVPGTLTLAAGASSATAELVGSVDQEDEGAETVTVTAAHGGASIGSATVTITSVSHDATLGALSLSGIDIGTFAPGRTTYTAAVAHDVSSTTLTATASHSAATVSIEPGTEVPLTEGENEIAVTVTAEDGETTKTYTVTVTRAGVPLTGSWASVPESHSGSGTAVLQVLFSEPVSTSYVTLKDASFRVTNGQVRQARRVDGRSDLWEIHVEPSADADLVVVLPATAHCEAAGAVCTAGGKALSGSLEATIPWVQAELPVVSIVAIEERVVGPLGYVRVSRTGPTGEPLEVQLLRSYSDRPSTTTVAAQFRRGQSSVRKGVQIGDNLYVEGDITVTWTLQAGEGYTVSAKQASASVVLEESEVPEYSVSASPAGVAEGGSATVTVAITNRIRFKEDQTIDLSVSGTASGSDYTGLPATLTLAARTYSVTAALAAVADGVAEGAETVTMTASHSGTEIGSATVTIAASEAASALTAEFLSIPATHDGETAFTFELRFSEEIEISYATLRDTAFEVTAGTVTEARRLARPSNLRWEITAEPVSDADMFLALPPTADCEAAGAICTVGGKALSQRVTATVKGPSDVEASGFSLTPENSRPSGIWSDGQTAWVADLEDARLYAYRLDDGQPQPDRDIATAPAPMGLWSDGETLWVVGLGGGLRAHRLANGTRQAWRDLALEANAAPAGVWSDGETAWVSEWLGDTVHAYRLADGKRAAERDVRLAGGNLLPVGLWSDSETLWVADWRERVYAYRLSDGRRDPDRDIDAGTADTDPSGLWASGGILLSTGWEGGRVRAHRMPQPRTLGRMPSKGGGIGLAARAASLPPIADPALRAAIRAALGKAPGETVSPEELAGLASLKARNAGIRDVAGLERAVGLQEIDIGFNPLGDLRPLASLPVLESLNLDGAAMDLTALGSLTGLRQLSIRHNRIADLGPLAGLAGLTELDIGENRIADLQPLAGLGDLAVLRADRNRIANLWPLASLAGLEALEMGANRIRDLRPLAGLARLQTLRLGGNGLADLHPLAGLAGLRDLGLSGNAVKDLGALSHLDGLRRLDLRGNMVANLHPLRGLRSLAWVHVGASRIADLAPLDGQPGLTVAGRDDRDSLGVSADLEEEGVQD